MIVIFFFGKSKIFDFSLRIDVAFANEQNASDQMTFCIILNLSVDARCGNLILLPGRSYHSV